MWCKNEGAGDTHAFECVDMLEKPLGGLICLVSFFGQLILENKNCNSKMLELLQGQLHGLCLMARLIFGCCPPCKGDIDETACHSTLGTATGAALKICERRQVKLCLYVTVPCFLRLQQYSTATGLISSSSRPLHSLDICASPGRSLVSIDLP